jgi:hypothetical protein
MRRLGAGIFAVALLGIVAIGANAQEPKADAKSKFGGTTFGGDSGSKSRADDKEEKEKAEDKKPAPPSPAEIAAKELKRHEKALVRRMQVCDRLRQIALDTNETDLERQAEELEEQAKTVYQRHADRLGVTAAVAAEKKHADKSTAAPRTPGRAGVQARRADKEGEDKP